MSWSLKELWSYLEKNGVETKVIWKNIKDVVVKTILSAENHMKNLILMNTRHPYSCHELLGFDILLDSDLKVWLLEVNISPSLHSSTQLDKKIKGPLIVDVLNTAGYRIPEPDDLAPIPNRNFDLSKYTPSSQFCMDKRFHNRKLSMEDKNKHSNYQQIYLDEGCIPVSILEKLTSNDIKVLIDTLDEQRRCGCLEIIFPSPSTEHYLKYFETQHYYNLLLQAWFKKYPFGNIDGIGLLNKLCWQEQHLKYVPPNSDATVINSHLENCNKEEK